MEDFDVNNYSMGSRQHLLYVILYDYCGEMFYSYMYIIIQGVTSNEAEGLAPVYS